MISTDNLIFSKNGNQRIVFTSGDYNYLFFQDTPDSIFFNTFNSQTILNLNVSGSLGDYVTLENSNGNKITNNNIISFTGFSSGLKIYLSNVSGNRINSKIKTISNGLCSGIDSVVFYGCENVENCILSGINLIPPTNFNKFINLKSLDFSRNQNLYVNITNSQQLEDLDLSHNQHVELNLKNQNNLKNLTATSSLFTSINCKSNFLDNVNLSNSRLKNVNFKTINKNCIIQGEASKPVETCSFTGLLTGLTLSNFDNFEFINNYSTPNLTNLNLIRSNNRLLNLTGFSNLKFGSFSDLLNCTGVNLSGCQNLESLRFTNCNRLSGILNYSFPNLNFVRMVNSTNNINLPRLTITGAKQLRNFTIINNGFSIINMSGCTNLPSFISVDSIPSKLISLNLLSCTGLGVITAPMPIASPGSLQIEQNLPLLSSLILLNPNTPVVNASLSLTGYPLLNNLQIQNQGLTGIYFRPNSSFDTLYLDGNFFTNLSITGINGIYTALQIKNNSNLTNLTVGDTLSPFSNIPTIEINTNVVLNNLNLNVQNINILEIGYNPSLASLSTSSPIYIETYANLAYCNLDAIQLDTFYTNLNDPGTATIYVLGNPGVAGHNPSIAEAKGYTVDTITEL